MKILQKGKRMLAMATSVCLTWTLALFWCSGTMSADADAELNIMSDGVLTYRQSDGLSTLIVTGAESSISGSLDIPSEYSGMKIVEIEEGAFYGQTGMTDVHIPETVQKIGSEAFYGCTSLGTVDLENTLQSAGADAFSETAWSLAHADDQLMVMDDVLLVSAADTAAEITLPDSVRVIADEAFMGNEILSSVTLTGYTGYIGKKSFYGCTALTNVILPSGVKLIGDYAFGESALSKAVVPATVLSIGKGAFIKCTQLQSVTLWNGLLKIGSNAFAACTSLSEITVPESVTEIGSSAFSRCTGLQKAVLSSSLRELSDNLFQDCTRLGSVVFGDKLVRIGSGVFNKCTAIRNIEIPESVRYIGSEAFQSCISLTSVNIPSSVIDVGVNVFFDTAFYNSIRAASTDSSFVIYDGRILLGYYGDDTVLQIPSGVEVIAGGAFSANETIETIMLPESVTSLSSYACDNLWTLRNITGTEYLSYIGEYVFWDCTSLQNMVFNDSITDIYDGAMFGCESLESVELGGGVETIGENAFSYSGLLSIDLPYNVMYVEKHAFEGCEELDRVVIRNRDCALGAECIPADVEIWGYRESTAFDYTQEYGNPFVDIDNPPGTTTQTSGTTTTTENTTIYTTMTTTIGTTVSTTATTVTYPSYTTTATRETTTTATTGTMALGVLEVGSIEVSPDDLQLTAYRVEVPLAVNNSGGWYSLGYGISYDPEKLTIDSIVLDLEMEAKVAEAGGNLKNYPAYNTAAGIVWDAFLPSSDSSVACPDGVFAYAVFTVNENVQAGEVLDITLIRENNGTSQHIETPDGAGQCELVSGCIMIADVQMTAPSHTTTTSTSTTTTATTITSRTYTTKTTTTTATTETTGTITTPTTTASTTTTTTASTRRTTATTTATTTVTTTMTTIQTSCSTAEPQEGDVDRDGTVGLSDASAALTAYANMAAGIAVPESLAKAADVNGDGKADLDDALMILTYYASVGAGITDQTFADWRDAQ